MLNLAQSLTKHKLVKLKAKTVFIDNIIFWLHYRVTVIALLVGVALLSSQEYIGEHIKCLWPKKELRPYIERYCFFMSTFTVEKLQNKSVIYGEIAHPGVGPFVHDARLEKDEIVKHTYYQWVVFVLGLQALAFYFPHLLWRKMEKEKLKHLISGIKMMEILNSETKRKSFDKIEVQLKNRMYTYQSWAWGLIFCESLNLVNLIFQIFLTELFLNHNFVSLGQKVYWEETTSEYHPLDVIFPKVAKCTLHKFGPSGSIQYHDILCILALNVVNEKIFIFLWFWYIILGILSVWILIWRFLSFFLRKWNRFNEYVFNISSLCKCDKRNLAIIMQNVSYGEWLFLSYLSGNMEGRLFDDLLQKLALTYERPPLVLLPTNVFQEIKPDEKPAAISQKLLIDFLG